MDGYGFDACELILERPLDRIAGTTDRGSKEQMLLHSGIWQELATRYCFYQASGYKHWVDHCPCVQCEIRRIELHSKPPVSPKSICVTDSQLNINYEVRGLRDNEFAVKGTYVDPHVMPGFKYTVRYLSRGAGQVFQEPRRLLSIGQGYGKRLTFEAGPSGADHFWSDSCPDGFALRLVAMETGQWFSLRSESGRLVGSAQITWVAPEAVEGTAWVTGPTVCARVGVAFKATVSLHCSCGQGCHEYEDIPMNGFACLEKKGRGVAAITKVEEVELPGFEPLLLLPEAADAQRQQRKHLLI